MNRLLAILALAAICVLTSGCVRYQVTLSNGNVVTAKSKPKLDPATSCYRFKDATGKEVLIPSVRVRAIEAK